jgi:hypothetical protein
VPYPPADAYREFVAQFVGTPSVCAAESDSYEGMAAIIAKVAPGFNLDQLPAGFRGYPVLVDDGTQTHEARGPLA